MIVIGVRCTSSLRLRFVRGALCLRARPLRPITSVLILTKSANCLNSRNFIGRPF